ncbi:MAG: universal stress protein [Cyclobacteriaceae bacterium]
MDSIKNVLVPIDFSKDSNAALSAANNFAQMSNSKVHLVNFFFPSDNVKQKHPKKAVLGNEDEIYQRQLDEEYQKILDELKSLAEKTLDPELKGKAFAVAAEISESFERFLEEVKIDFIIAGDESSKGLLEFFEGSRSENMLQDADVPVMVVEDSDDFVFDDIMIATDLSLEIPVTSLGICKFFQSNGATVHFVNVITTDVDTKKEVKGKIEQLAENAGFEEYEIFITRSEKEVDGIREAIKEISPDLVLMKTYEKSRVWRLIFGSLTEKVIRDWDVHVLAEKVDNH